MNTIGQRNLLNTLLVSALAMIGEQAHAMETGVYQASDISKFFLIGEDDSDGDSDGVKETHIMRYRNEAGDKVFSMSTKDRLWAWSLESISGAGVANVDHNYVRRDSDCDGTLDEQYSLDEQFYIPDCLK